MSAATTKPENISQQIAALEKRKVDLERLIALESDVTKLEMRLLIGREAIVKIAREITLIVAPHFNLTFTSIRSRNRQEHIVWPRMIVYYLIRKITGEQWSTIGRVLERDHGTIMYGVEAVQGRIDTNQQFAIQLEALEKLCIEKIKDLVPQ